MRNLILTLLILLFSNSMFAVADTAPASATIQWQEYSTQPFDEAKNAKHFILLFFKSATCHWCQLTESVNWQNPALIQEVQSDYIPVRVDVDSRADVVVKYHVTALPTLIILNDKNEIIKIYAGYFSPDFMLKNLKDINANYANLTAHAITPEALQAQTVAPTPTVNVNVLPDSIVQVLEKKQLAIFSNANNHTDFNIDTINYALLLTGKDKQVAQNWITTMLDSAATLSAAQALKIYAKLYADWQNPMYLNLAKKVFNTMDTNPMQYANDNGRLIAGLTYYYMVSGDENALTKAQTLMKTVYDGLSIPGGGFRHEKDNNDVIYINDTIAMANANLLLYKATQNANYLQAALSAAGFINQYFANNGDATGYVNAVNLVTPPKVSTATTAEDNAHIVTLTALLFSYTGDKRIQQMEMRAFRYLTNPEVIANSPPALILTANYIVANMPLHITIVGAKDASGAKQLYQFALSHAAWYSRLDWWDAKEGPLLNSDTTYQMTDKPAAYICHGYQCSFPMYSEADLLAAIKNTSASTPVTTQMTTLKPSHSIISPHALNKAEKLLRSGNWLLIIVGFIGFGLLISFTPCILPLVPIMASIIVGNTIGVSKTRTFLLCLTYVFSMSITYALLGVLAAMFGVYLQAYMQAPIVITLFSLIFLILGLSMLGAYELTFPQSWQQKVNKWSNLQKGGTFFGVMVMGILSTLILSPCVSAPLLGVLSFIAKNGDCFVGALVLFLMGIGMGIPLLIITLFSKNILPKASRWNNQIKHFFGIILLGAAIWMVNRILSETVGMMLWSALIIFATLYMGITKSRVKTLFAKVWKTITILLFVFGVALFIDALFIQSELYPLLKANTAVFLNNRPLASAPVYEEIKSLADWQNAMSVAKQKHLPVMLDFTAQWCSACVNLKREVLDQPQVTNLLKQFMLLRVDLTNANDDVMAVARQFHIAGPPVILLFDSNAQQFNEEQIAGDIKVDEFARLLQEILATQNVSN